MTKKDLAVLTQEAMVQGAIEAARRAMARSFLEDRYGPDMVTDEMIDSVLEELDKLSSMQEDL